MVHIGVGRFSSQRGVHYQEHIGVFIGSDVQHTFSHYFSVFLGQICARVLDKMYYRQKRMCERVSSRYPLFRHYYKHFVQQVVEPRQVLDPLKVAFFNRVEVQIL